MGLAALAFVVGAVASLVTSWVLISRLERIGARLGFSEALLGMVAAVAADAPEITASITALAHHQEAVGAGVVLGSNVFNLAALLGLGAYVAGSIVLHRRVVVLNGVVAVTVAAVSLLAVTRALAPSAALVLVLAVLVPYVALLARRWAVLSRFPWLHHQAEWLNRAITEEESELEPAIHPRRSRPVDELQAVGALILVIVASVAMERGATALGAHFGVAEIVTGAIVLAAVTSLPNAVSAVYLARGGKGAATLSTALNSNSINVAVGLLIPATLLGLSNPSGSSVYVTVAYLVMTVATLLLAYLGNGLVRRAGLVIMVLYAVFAVALVAGT